MPIRAHNVRSPECLLKAKVPIPKTSNSPTGPAYLLSAAAPSHAQTTSGREIPPNANDIKVMAYQLQI